jgi:hypothetical protein
MSSGLEKLGVNMSKEQSKIIRSGSQFLRLFIALSLIASLLVYFIGAKAVYAAEPEVIRSMPATVNPGQTFSVSVTFTTPADYTNTVGLNEAAAPSGWTVAANKASCDPDADQSNVVGNAAQYIWYGPDPDSFDAGIVITGVYQVTVPADATPGTYNFTGGQLTYYITSEKHTTTVGGQNSINVVAANTAPTANAVTTSTNQNTAKSITLSGSDSETVNLTFSIVAQPAHGTLGSITNNAGVAGTPNTDSAAVTFTPTTGYTGSDTFTYKVNDGTVDSAAATVTIDVIAVNTAPTANDVTTSTNQNTAKAITLSGSDAQSVNLTFAIGTGPAHGTLSAITNNAGVSGTPNTDSAAVTYTPAAGYSGSDTFTYTVTDTSSASDTATVTITVVEVNGVTVSVQAPSSVSPGSDFTATLDITSVTGLSVANYTVSFDPAVLDLTDITDGAIGGTPVNADMDNEAEPGVYKAVSNVPAGAGATGSGTLAVLHFHVLGADGQTSAISLSEGTLASVDVVEIPASWVNDSVEVVNNAVVITISNKNQIYDGTPKSVTITTNPAGVAYSVTYSGSATPPTNAGSYNVVVTITDASYSGTASDTLVIARANQTITFPAIGDKGLASPDFTLNATASSGLAVTYSASGPCTVNGNVVHITGLGECQITARQAGNSNYNAVESVQTFSVVQLNGDANEDGDVNAVDITYIEMVIVGLIENGDYDFDAVDVNGDDAINAVDIAAVKDIILNSID